MSVAAEPARTVAPLVMPLAMWSEYWWVSPWLGSVLGLGIGLGLTLTLTLDPNPNPNLKEEDGPGCARLALAGHLLRAGAAARIHLHER